jgi:hypothetical protein
VTEPDLVGLFVAPLETLGVDYMITGGVASVIYGDPRFTRDIDLVLELREGDAGGLLDAFSPDDFYRPPLEALREEIRRPRHGHFNIIHRDTALRADVYLVGDDPLHVWAFERRVRIPLEEDAAIWLAPPEYVVVRKLQYHSESGSERHLRDVAAMLEISRDKIDVIEVEGWAHRLGLAAALRAARSFNR